MFKFDFIPPKSEDGAAEEFPSADTQALPKLRQASMLPASRVQWGDGENVVCPQTIVLLQDVYHVPLWHSHDVVFAPTIEFVTLQGTMKEGMSVEKVEISSKAREHSLLRVVPTRDACPAPQDTDLLPGVYEGGMKVWEASIDMVDYLLDVGFMNGGVLEGEDAEEILGEDIAESANTCFQVSRGEGVGGGGERRKENLSKRPEGQMRVLEDGPKPYWHMFNTVIMSSKDLKTLKSIYHPQTGCHVCFSDYNREVLVHATMPNVRINVPLSLWHLGEFFCGDWNALSPLLEVDSHGGKFDLILTAETLYNVEVTQKVLDMILRHLAPEGRAIVASKRFYFGTGGSTAHFRAQVAAEGRLCCRDVKVFDTGRGNIREVMEVTWHKQ